MPAPGQPPSNDPSGEEPWWVGQILPMPSSPPVAPSRPPLGGAGSQPPTVPPYLGGQWQQPAPQQPAPTPRGDRNGRRLLVAAGLAVVAVLMVSAATWGWSEVRRGLDRSGSATGVPLVPAERDATGSVPASSNRVVVRGGDPASRSQQLVKAALADVDSFWRDNWSKVGSGAYRTVSGGFYAFGDGSTPPCVEDARAVAGNAFYCPEQDVIAWDEVNLVPRLQKNYGDLGVGLVVAHEWGHAVQVRAGVTDQPTIFMEQQADCYAGAWVADARRRNDVFKVDDDTLDTAMAGFLELRDPVGMTNASSPGAHGTAFDRIRAFQEGVDDGVGRCADYQLDQLPLVAIDFQSYEDYASGGNLPLADSVDLTVKDLEDFWAERGADLGGSAGATVPTVDVDGTGRESCRGSVTLAGKVTYCPSTNTVTVPPDLAAKAHGKIGDFALSALIGAGWSAAVLDGSGQLPSQQLAREEAANCLAGAWTRSVFDGDREGAQLSLSPGDLDEAVAAMLGTRSGTTGTGFDRVTAYRQGFTDGVAACTR
jgi:predicted metalloprotease